MDKFELSNKLSGLSKPHLCQNFLFKIINFLSKMIYNFSKFIDPTPLWRSRRSKPTRSLGRPVRPIFLHAINLTRICALVSTRSWLHTDKHRVLDRIGSWTAINERSARRGRYFVHASACAGRGKLARRPTSVTRPRDPLHVCKHVCDCALASGLVWFL